MEETQSTSIGQFNFAHSYAQSAIELRKIAVEASHPTASVSFLFFHAIELYLKSYLTANGFSDEEMKAIGHKLRKLANKAQKCGLKLTDEDEQLMSYLSQTDNIIRSHYVRLGGYSRLPTDVYHETCYRLHTQIGPQLYSGSGVARIPRLTPASHNELEMRQVSDNS